MHSRWGDMEIVDEDFPPTIRAKPGWGRAADQSFPAPLPENHHDYRALPQEQDDAIKVQDFFFVIIRMCFQSCLASQLRTRASLQSVGCRVETAIHATCFFCYGLRLRLRCVVIVWVRPNTLALLVQLWLCSTNLAPPVS